MTSFMLKLDNEECTLEDCKNYLDYKYALGSTYQDEYRALIYLHDLRGPIEAKCKKREFIQLNLRKLLGILKDDV